MTFDNFYIIQDGRISSARLTILYVRSKAAKFLLQSLVAKKMEKLLQRMEAAWEFLLQALETQKLAFEF